MEWIDIIFALVIALLIGFGLGVGIMALRMSRLIKEGKMILKGGNDATAKKDV